jgi:hypothetical protein
MQLAMASCYWIQSLMLKGGKFFSQFRPIDVFQVMCSEIAADVCQMA